MSEFATGKLAADLLPMEARLVADLPAEPGWQFEPKWDGFRCLALRDGDQIELRAKSGRPLARYFPEIVTALRELRPGLFIVDGELAIPVGETLSFDHVGSTATLRGFDREGLTKNLEALVAPPGFTGNAPGGPSRWSTERSAEWEPLRPELVVDVRYDHVSGNRFRHGTKFLRWRPDKDPRQCTFDQLECTLIRADHGIFAKCRTRSRA
jgi:ATP-dependent DNA ligase